MTHYTIVAIYPDGDSFVDWVTAKGTEYAVKELEVVRGPSDGDWSPVAIFEGHLNDLTGQIGCPTCEGSSEIRVDNDKAYKDGLPAIRFEPCPDCQSTE